ncbi:hypothetical protein GCM10022259_10020 [Aquimarina mytili]
MAMNDRKPISSLLSTLFKKSLSTIQLQMIADEFNVHYNTIINIRDRRKKSPDKMILENMIKLSILSQKKSIEEGKELILLLEQELEKLK